MRKEGLGLREHADADARELIGTLRKADCQREELVGLPKVIRKARIAGPVRALTTVSLRSFTDHALHGHSGARCQCLRAADWKISYSDRIQDYSPDPF
jgi:hypothetical protein